MISTFLLSKAQIAAHSCDVFFTIGTSGIVEPAASLPFIALSSGAKLIESNLNDTPTSRYSDYVLRDVAGTVLPDLIKLVGTNFFL